MRTSAFYNLWAAKRVYFYQVDLRGRLFLDSPTLLRRNEATCLRDVQFLDFFFKHLQPIARFSASPLYTKWKDTIHQFENEYPWISPCGRELNFVRADDTPIVYKDLIENGGESWLTYAGTLKQKFDPSRLAVRNERVYFINTTGDLGLLHPDLAQRISANIDLQSGHFTWQSARYVLPTIT